MKSLKYILLLFIVLQATSCLDTEDQIPQSQIDEEQVIGYLNSKNIDATRDQNGYYYSIIDSGAGETLVDTSVIRLRIELTNISNSSKKVDTTLIKAIKNLGYAIRLGVTKVKTGGKINIYIPAYLYDGENNVAAKCTPIQYFENQKVADDTIINEYLTSHLLTATKDTVSGIYYNISTPGSDNSPDINSTITVKYSGKLTNDYIFDSTAESATFTYPLKSLIPGWRYALPMLGEGGKGRFYFPSALAYGDQALTEIPSNSVLIFDITLVSTK